MCQRMVEMRVMAVGAHQGLRIRGWEVFSMSALEEIAIEGIEAEM